jgi:Mg-chelatase subunit ChlD
MNSKIVLSVVLVVVMLLSVLSTAPVMSGDEQVEGTIDASPLSIMPESRPTVGAEGSLELNNDDELCTDVDIIFIIDCSGSMQTEDAEVGGVTVSRLEAAQNAAQEFIDLLPTGTNTRVGVVSFESFGYADIEQSLTTNFVAAQDAIEDLSIRGWEALTSIGEGFEKAREELEDHGGANKRVFLLLTDGIANDYPSGWSPPAGWIAPPVVWDPDPAKETAEKYAFVEAHSSMTLDADNPTKVYTVGMGEQDDINEDFLEVLAHSSGGEYFFGGTTLVSYMFAEVRADICLGDVIVLILANLPRMADLYGLSLIDSDPLANELTNAIQNLADNNPNGRGVIVDLGYLGDASIDTAYSNWDGNEGDVTRTNNLVDEIDDYIEDLKQDDVDGYPLLRYVIIVGSHEVIPMQARPDDHQWWIDGPYGYWLDERHWADGLPQTSGYLYDLYHAGTHGHYLTDTPYSDLSYRDTSADHELSPEISVARIVETPQQIIDVIDAYMDNNGEIPTNNFVSMASYDYVDGGTQASDYMDATGVATDDTLVDCAYDSTDIPPLLNAQHDIVYIAGHGEYNWITTTDRRDGVSPSSDGFMAGDSATRGCTDDINPIDGAVIVTSGCHNGVNFGNILYHAPDETYFPTTYSEFPEDFAARGTVAYAGATGYTVITGTECDTDTSRTGYNERLATNVVYYVVNGVDIGRAFRNGARDYFRAAQPLSDVHRRVLAIATLYGIPTYKDSPTEPPSPGETLKASVGIQKSSYDRSGQPAPTSETITIVISDYTVEASGLVDIPGVEQVVSYNEPILPELFVEKTLPRDSSVLSVKWAEGSSESVVVANDVPIAGVGCREASFPGAFQYDGFYPPEPYQGYGLLTFGAGGSEVGLSINPVQYNEATGETKIWTKMVFDVEYQVPDTGVSVVSLAADKEEYSSDDTVELSMEVSSSTYTRLVDLDVIMRDLNTSDELATLGIGLMGLEGGASTEGSYSMELGDIPAYQIAGKTIEAELVVSDPHNGDILASRSVTFEVVPEGVYLDLQHSSAPFCRTTPVKVWVNATEFKAGQIRLRYDSTCADVTEWTPNTTDFPLATWDSTTPGEEWITFSALAAKTGKYLIGTLTIHCVSEEECNTELDFVEEEPMPSKLFDEWGNEIRTTWQDGSFTCVLGMCGDVAPYPNCNSLVDMGDVSLLHSYVGYPGQYSLCCEWCGDVAPYPDCNGTLDMGDVSLLHSYVGYPGQYALCCQGAASKAAASALLAAAMQNEVSLVPHDSSAPFCNTTEVQVWVDATNFKAGQIKLTYDSTCADVTNWVANSADFPLATWESGTPAEEWITFSAPAAKTGSYLIGTLTIHCVSEEECTTALDFVEGGAMPSKLFDDWGKEITATWTDGTLRKGKYEAYLPPIIKNFQ